MTLISKSQIKKQARKTANLGGGGVAHAAPENIEDLISSKDGITGRVVDALSKVDPDTDRVDEMTYARIIKGANLEHLRNSSVNGRDYGFVGFGTSLLAPQNDLQESIIGVKRMKTEK